MDIAKVIKEARIKKGMTRRNWQILYMLPGRRSQNGELGKSVPDEAFLNLLYS